jgi:hypothetical protein
LGFYVALGRSIRGDLETLTRGPCCSKSPFWYRLGLNPKNQRRYPPSSY